MSYRHFYRQFIEVQHWRGFAGGSAKTYLPMSIEIYRLRTPASTSISGIGTPRHRTIQVLVA